MNYLVLLKTKIFCEDVWVFLIFVSSIACVKEKTSPTPYIWMNKESCISGDTLIFRDKSINSKSRLWYLPDTSLSDKEEIIFLTNNISSGYRWISMEAIGEDNLERAIQKKLIRIVNKSWLVIDFGNRIDTVYFRMIYSHYLGVNNFYEATRKNLFGNKYQSLVFTVYNSYRSYLSADEFPVKPFPGPYNEPFPKIEPEGIFSFRGLVSSADYGIVGVINPRDTTGLIQTLGGQWNFHLKFDNLPAEYVSIHPNQQPDTIPVSLSGLIYSEDFDYIEE